MTAVLDRRVRGYISRRLAENPDHVIPLVGEVVSDFGLPLHEARDAVEQVREEQRFLPPPPPSPEELASRRQRKLAAGVLVAVDILVDVYRGTHAAELADAAARLRTVFERIESEAR